MVSIKFFRKMHTILRENAQIKTIKSKVTKEQTRASRWYKAKPYQRRESRWPYKIWLWYKEP